MRQLARRGQLLLVFQDAAPQVGNALARERRIGCDRRRPIRRTGVEDVERGPVFRGGGKRALAVVAVRLVHRDHVGELDHALLEALQLVARARDRQQQEEIGHVGNRGFRLTDADRLDQHHVEAGGFADQHGLAGLGRHAAEASRRGGGADEGQPLYTYAKDKKPGDVKGDNVGKVWHVAK